jgi:photosystem II stability/assembly factor-like uncharacterized protein
MPIARIDKAAGTRLRLYPKPQSQTPSGCKARPRPAVRFRRPGAHWTKVFPLDDRAFNASSIAVGGPEDDDIYISCEPLGLSPCLAALLHSPDGGRTWTDLYDPSLGALRMKTIAVNPKTGTVEVGTCGNGTFRVVPKR